MDVIQEKQKIVNLSLIERQLSFVAGAVLLLYAMWQRSWVGFITALAAAGLLYRGTRGYSYLYEWLGLAVAVPEATGIAVNEAVIVNRSPEETYRFWRQLENLPRFMSHLESVHTMNGRSHWIVSTPVGTTLEWDAEITEDRPHELIAWQTAPQAMIQHSGQVSFQPLPNNRGTKVTVSLTYDPPGGIVGETFAQLLNVVTAQQIKEEIRQFKHILEAGELPTTTGQPTGKGRA